MRPCLVVRLRVPCHSHTLVRCTSCSALPCVHLAIVMSWCHALCVMHRCVLSHILMHALSRLCFCAMHSLRCTPHALSCAFTHVLPRSCLGALMCHATASLTPSVGACPYASCYCLLDIHLLVPLLGPATGSFLDTFSLNPCAFGISTVEASIHANLNIRLISL